MINAALYPDGDGRLFELTAEDGVWRTVREQEGAVHEPGAIRLADIRFGEGGSGGVPFGNRAAASPDAPADAAIDLEGRMLLPGFVDAHMHLDKAFSLPAVPNRSGTLWEAIENYRKAVPAFGKDEIRDRIIQTAMLALSSGSTVLRSHLDFHLHAGADVAMRTIEAALEAREKLRHLIDIQFFPMFPYHGCSPQDEELMKETIRMGMDGIGGAPHLSPTPDADIARLFRMADELGCPIDLHADENDDPAVRTVLTIAAQTKRYGFEGRVTVGHLCSLAGMPQDAADDVMERMAEARLKAVTLPAANLYLQGRGDRGIVRRGVTRVKELQEAASRWRPLPTTSTIRSTRSAGEMCCRSPSSPDTRPTWAARGTCGSCSG
jgi:cytosine deaminase